MTAASTYEDMKEINAFTGDGGSIAVHGNQDDTQLTITDAEFNTTRAEGTGGAIYIARDADPANRALFTAWTGKFSDKDWARDNPTPDVLGGGCNGLLTRVTFTTCEAGVEGGGMILCGRGVQVVLDECNFSECKAGVVHETDGKGGAIAFGGGHHGTKSGDDNSPESHTPHGKMTIQGSTTIDQCTSSDNGGGIYLTISGEIEMNDTTINDCYALGSTGVAGHEPKCLEEGLGGGLHVSAGGMLRVRDGCTISENRARHSGGGIGCKNGLVDVAATATAITIVVLPALACDLSLVAIASAHE
jgi:parallel beta-helix repeat protein